MSFRSRKADCRKFADQTNGVLHPSHPLPPAAPPGGVMMLCQHSRPARRRNGDPYGNRTRVSAVKGPRPRPLDEGAIGSAARQRCEARRALGVGCVAVNPLLSGKCHRCRGLQTGYPVAAKRQAATRPAPHIGHMARDLKVTNCHRPRRHPPDAARRWRGRSIHPPWRGRPPIAAGRAVRPALPDPDRIPPGGRRWS